MFEVSREVRVAASLGHSAPALRSSQAGTRYARRGSGLQVLSAKQAAACSVKVDQPNDTAATTADPLRTSELRGSAVLRK